MSDRHGDESDTSGYDVLKVFGCAAAGLAIVFGVAATFIDRDADTAAAPTATQQADPWKNPSSFGYPRSPFPR